ncbi:MAG: MoxR family ATPase [Candidatus Altiarchaeota archaeon]
MGRIYQRIVGEVGKVFVGQDEVLKQITIAIFTDSHALVEGFPGLGKTLMVKTLSDVMELKFSRIQCTPDLMPSDITGTYIVDEDESRKKSFRFEKGPVFTNILLADEINRATPKSQSALLESMQERQVTVGPTTYKLERPFLVLATQNPIEMEGTYPLPEAQVDRFLFKILIKYPSDEDERRIIRLYTTKGLQEVSRVISKQEVISIHELTRKMPISNDCLDYAQKIVSTTRPKDGGVAKKYLEYGASPRAGIGLVLAAKALALVEGRNYVSEKDIEAMCYPILRHRLILNFESERKGLTTDNVITELLKEV